MLCRVTLLSKEMVDTERVRLVINRYGTVGGRHAARPRMTQGMGAVYGLA